MKGVVGSLDRIVMPVPPLDYPANVREAAVAYGTWFSETWFNVPLHVLLKEVQTDDGSGGVVYNYFH